MASDVFIIGLFGLLALWLAVGIFSSPLASETTCQQCGAPVFYAMSKPGVKDIAFCGTCGVAVFPISVLVDPNSEQDGSV